MRLDVDPARRDPAEHHVERVGPHPVGLRPRQNAVLRAVVRQLLVEVQRGLVDDGVAVAVDDDGVRLWVLLSRPKI